MSTGPTRLLIMALLLAISPAASLALPLCAPGAPETAACTPPPPAPAASSLGGALPPSSTVPGLSAAPSFYRRDALLIRFFCLVTIALVLYPILRFLYRVWSFRQEKIFGTLAGDAVVFYYLQFRPGSNIVRDFPPPRANPHRPYYPPELSAVYMGAFTSDFYRWYGRKYYIAPVVMLTVLIAILGGWSEKVLRFWAATSSNPAGLRALTASALAGALVWVISDEIDRLRRRDFTTSDVFYYVFRILLSVPFGWSLSVVYIGDKPIGLSAAIPIAFFLGAFPTQTLFTIARRIASQNLRLGDDQGTGILELEKLQAIGKSTAERFKDEGIATISSLAYSDPIDLTIRTNFDFNYVVSCVSQALIYIYFGEDVKKLARYSMIGALEIAAVMRWTNDPDPYKRAIADKAITDAAADLKLSEEALRVNFAQISEDPYTMFLANVWS